MTDEKAVVRPTKKQRELLAFIGAFITEHGYSPSYREIMTGLNYTSVATVALHVNNLIKRGHLRKRDHSARSLEVVVGQLQSTAAVASKQLAGEQWLTAKIEAFLADLEQAAQPAEAKLDQACVLVAGLKVLGLEMAAAAYLPRLEALQQAVNS